MNFVGFLKFYTFAACRVSLVRPAPAEFPQDRKVARVGGRAVRYKELTRFLSINLCFMISYLLTLQRTF